MDTKMAVLILGDLHIDGSQNLGCQIVGSSLNSRVLDRLSQLDWVHRQAISHNVNHLILTGDIFDTPRPHYSIMVLFLEWLQKCTDHGINVHIVVGNHDMLRSGQIVSSPLDILSTADLPNIFVYKKISTLMLPKMGITFLPFRDRRSFATDSNSDAINLLSAQLPYELTSIDDDCLKILVGHLALEGAIPVGYELDELTNELHCPLDMFQGYDYVWMGHVHKFQVMCDKPHIVHIGSMDISDFGETDHRKCIVIVDPEQEQPVKYLDIPTRPLKNITIQLPGSTINATEYVEQQLLQVNDLANSIVKVTIMLPSNASYNIDRPRIERLLQAQGAHHISKISEERKFVSLKRQINENVTNTVSEFSAIRTYASLIEDSLKSTFIQIASDIVQECKTNGK